MSLENQNAALNVLAEIWEMSPDVRLGQLMAHLGFLGESHLGRGLGDIDDDEMLSMLYRHRDELRARLLKVASSAVDRGASTWSSTARQMPASPVAK
jgi:hypothetical protein